VDDLPEDILYQDVSVDILFTDPKPWFRDLFRCNTSEARRSRFTHYSSKNRPVINRDSNCHKLIYA